MVTNDPLTAFSRLATKLKTVWLQYTYRFPSFGRGVSIHYSCDVGREASPEIVIGDGVYMSENVWLNVAGPSGSEPKMVVGRGCKIGRRSTISARNRVVLEEDVLLAPAVLIMDHNHEYSDPQLPIHAQGITRGGAIKIERNCWIGYNAVIFCGKGELTLGRNSVVGANSVVTKSFPPYSVVAGNPAEIVRTFDETSGKWIRVGSANLEPELVRRLDASSSR